MAENIISIDHFLNRQEKSKTYQSENYYPVYIQLKVEGNQKQIRSRINEHLKIYRSDLDRITQRDKRLEKLILSGFFSQTLFDKLMNQELFPIYHLLNDEKNVLNAILSEKESPGKNPSDNLGHVEKEYKRYTLEISDVIDIRIKKQYREELHGIFLQSIDHEKDKKLFKIVNYLIHFVNWDNSFYYFYNNTYEIIPSGLKEVENRLSKELLIVMKAYLALHTQINLIKRFLEKRELGKISTLSYLDWRTSVKDIVGKHFVRLFGREKGLEYLNALDTVLEEEVEIHPLHPRRGSQPPDRK